MQNFIRKPMLDLYPGIRVDEKTVFFYENKNVRQSVDKLVFRSVTKIEGENFHSVYDTTIQLQEGDVLLFEDEGRGYIKPVDSFVSIEEAIEDLSNIKDLGGE